MTDDTRELVARLREMADWCRESVVYGKAAVCDDAASRLEALEGERAKSGDWRALRDANDRAEQAERLLALAVPYIEAVRDAHPATAHDSCDCARRSHSAECVSRA